jgi:uncharacterized protein YjiS (DUF1127 family)
MPSGKTMLCEAHGVAAMRRARYVNSCDLEHFNVNTPRRDPDRSARHARVAPRRSFSIWLMVCACGAFPPDRVWAARRRQRLTLAELCQQPHLLDDLGLTPAQARREARKPFWRP